MKKNDETLCIYLAFFGVLIALTCLIQLFVYSNFSLIPLVLMTLYLFNIISFILLGLQKKIAPEFIFSGVIVSFFIWLIYTFSYVVSLIVILLFIYNLAVAATILICDLHKKIKYKSSLMQAEKEYWEGKL